MQPAKQGPSYNNSTTQLHFKPFCIHNDSTRHWNNPAYTNGLPPIFFRCLKITSKHCCSNRHPSIFVVSSVIRLMNNIDTCRISDKYSSGCLSLSCNERNGTSIVLHVTSFVKRSVYCKMSKTSEMWLHIRELINF